MKPLHQLRYPLLAILTLAGVALACAGEPAGGDPTLAASFSTATPGGRISVSLLTPTLTLEGPPDQATTPIGPVATATAAAQLAAAQTATALVPTPTIPGVFTTPAVCPSPGNPSLPTQPTTFNRYAEVIARYLSEGGPPTVLEATLRSWGTVSEAGGLVRADRDFTGDGVPEVLIVLLDPEYSETAPQPGDLYLFGCEDGAYRLLYQAGYDPDRSAPLIVSADDINGDYLNDLVYVLYTCGPTVCQGEVQAVEWSLTLGNFDTLLSEEIVEPAPEVLISDVEGDGLGEIVITTGTDTSPAAGPQRTYTRIYAWDGTLYTLSEEIASPAEYRIHVIHDGDDALLTGDYATAVERYRQAIDDGRLLSWQYPNEADYLRAFARYRLMLAYVLQDDISAAQTAHDELVNAFAAPSPEGQPPPGGPLLNQAPGVEFARMADFFWSDFAVNRDVGRACQVVVGYARANPASFEVLNSFGYTNRSYTAVDMCPFGS
ncbi:MAG TPA: hypothetical protein ENI95_00425 [Chloroflexi bacterium]|nr:hypothetical protein [Chloroflexota bacterium]